MPDLPGALLHARLENGSVLRMESTPYGFAGFDPFRFGREEEGHFIDMDGGAIPAKTALLPEGDFALSLDLGAVVAQEEGARVMAGVLMGLAATKMGVGFLEVPEDPAAAQGLAVLQATLASLPSSLSPRSLEVAVSNLARTPIVQARLGLEGAPTGSPIWGERWDPPALPKGLALLRLERPRAALWPLVAERIELWGFEVPPTPASDFALEVVLHEAGGSPGLSLVAPSDWLPATDYWDAPLLDLIDGIELPPSLLPEVAPEWASVGGTTVFLLGDVAFRASVRTAIGGYRPPLWAERRVHWPRGSLATVIDYRGIQAMLASFAPVAIPDLTALLDESARSAQLELALFMDGGSLRLYGFLPASLVPSVSRVANQMLGGLR